MKGFLVFSRLNDILFFALDDEFTVHVNQKAKSAGLIETIHGDHRPVDPNVVVQIFSPLVASQRFMIEQVKNGYSAITCENDFTFVFKQFDDLLLIAINGDSSENKDFMLRKCLLFQRLIGFLFGPVINEMKPDRLNERKQRWKNITRLLDTWLQLAQDEQAFLVEATERLHVNLLVSEKSVGLLEETISRIQSMGEKNAQHALLLVNSKLLALYSNRNAYELQSSDILMITLLAKDLFPSGERLETLFSHSYRNTESSSSSGEQRLTQGTKYYPHRPDLYESAFEGDDEDSEGDDEYYSPRTTPVNEEIPVETNDKHSTSSNTDNGSRSAKRPHMLGVIQCIDEESSNKYQAHKTAPYPRVSTPGNSEVFHTPDEVASPLRESKPPSVTQEPPEDITFSSDTIHTKTLEESSTVDFNEPVSGVVRYTVFLKSPVCQFAPHVIHCAQIFPGIALIIITETPRAVQAGLICQALSMLKDITEGRKNALFKAHGQYTCDVISALLNKTLASFKKPKGHLAKTIKDIKSRWEDAKSNGLMNFLEESTITDIPPRIESQLSSLVDKLKNLFSYLYIKPRVNMSALTKAVEAAQDMVVSQLQDYKDYLSVKAQRNITMTTYLEDFPGLIHFIYIDRLTNQMTAPSLNVTRPDEGTVHDATQLIKDKMWERVRWMQARLLDGYTTITVRDGDFHFSYFLWFEDSGGNPMSVQQPFSPNKDYPPPGILTGNFYRQLIRQCFPNSVPGSVYCYELFCMHIGLVHTQYIVSHCRKLAAMMWETSMDALAPASLL